MQTDSQVSVSHDANLHPDNVSSKDVDCGQKNLVPQQPAKKPTRQWAAWTRQEEESFFTALRQVGKNFEKITCRVQSKNKDQVRHYYYRLVRRMNKLLGPGLCLDAKNSKDTNAAMLRWWSLLEKYSCKASKLHLKPRRFKIFLDALENQLLKDRKRNVRKRHPQGENCSPAASNTIPSQNRASGNDNRSVKLVLFDSQNIQKLGPGKVPLKRNGNSVNRSNNRGDSAAMKPPRQRRKAAGVVSSASYKKWEKAAIAGVSLVADAAEHLERTTNDKEFENGHPALGQMNSDTVGNPSPDHPNSSQNLLVENTQASTKVKLQLFPIDDNTRKALEMDKHNPHLELTLSTRKRISSVVEHLNRKWGNSSAACGDLMLFPYSVQRENLVAYSRWNQNSMITAAEIYTMIGSPPVFRLRYGWFSNEELASGAGQGPIASSVLLHTKNIESSNDLIVDSMTTSQPSADKRLEDFGHQGKDQTTSVNQGHSLSPSSISLPTGMSKLNDLSNYEAVNSSDTGACGAWDVKENDDRTTVRQFVDLDDMRSNGTALSAGEWADSLTNVSVGDLLAEVPQDMDVDYLTPPVMGNTQCFQQTPFSCDSFDAAIAAHISRQQDKLGIQQCMPSHTSSIWDAEETCDAFSFQKNCGLHLGVPNISGTDACKVSKPITRRNSGCSADLDEKLPEERVSGDSSDCADPMDECISGNPSKDFNSLTDIYWPDSLGPLDLEIPSSKYHNEDLILSDSLGGLARLLSNSLDAFQNFHSVGLDKKDSDPALASRESAAISDCKVSAEV